MRRMSHVSRRDQRKNQSSRDRARDSFQPGRQLGSERFGSEHQVLVWKVSREKVRLCPGGQHGRGLRVVGRRTAEGYRNRHRHDGRSSSGGGWNRGRRHGADYRIVPLGTEGWRGRSAGGLALLPRAKRRRAGPAFRPACRLPGHWGYDLQQPSSLETLDAASSDGSLRRAPEHHRGQRECC